MKLQEFYNNTCSSLRTYGNPYGGLYFRGWSWVNNDNPNERCAIARFIKGNTETEMYTNLVEELGASSKMTLQLEFPIVREIISLFDDYSCEVNNKKRLEVHLAKLAEKYKLEYTPIAEVVEAVEEAEV